jgi:hypothetical protein
LLTARVAGRLPAARNLDRLLAVGNDFRRFFKKGIGVSSSARRFQQRLALLRVERDYSWRGLVGKKRSLGWLARAVNGLGRGGRRRGSGEFQGQGGGSVGSWPGVS